MPQSENGIAPHDYVIREYCAEDIPNLTDEDSEYIRKHFSNLELYKTRISNGPYAGIIEVPSGKRLYFSEKIQLNAVWMLSYLKGEGKKFFNLKNKYFVYDPDKQIVMDDGEAFFDVIGQMFLQCLRELLKFGLSKRYIPSEENLRYLRGKILIKEQIKHNYIDHSRIFCHYSDLTFDNPENRVLLAALDALIHFIRFNEDLRMDLRSYEKRLIKDFNIRLTDMALDYCDRINPDRINRRYNYVLRLSKLILMRAFIESTEKGKATGFNFLVNMNQLYESFLTEVFSETARNESFTLNSQVTFENLAMLEDGTPSGIIVKPDVVINLESNKPKFIIIDFKYKKDVNNAEYYQIIAYLLAVKRPGVIGCLIYPKQGKNKEKPLIYVARNVDDKENNDRIPIFVKFIDLNTDGTNDYYTYVKKIERQAKEIIEELNRAQKKS